MQERETTFGNVEVHLNFTEAHEPMMLKRGPDYTRIIVALIFPATDPRADGAGLT